MQTRHKQLSYSFLKKSKKREQTMQQKINQQIPLDNKNFFEKFVQFYDLVKNIQILELEYVQEFFLIEVILNNEQIFEIQQKLALQWSTKARKNWCDEERRVLEWITLKMVSYRGYQITNIPNDAWEQISQLMSRRTSENCKAKWIGLARTPLQQVPWTKNQDAQLIQLINKFKQDGQPNKWSQIAFELNQGSHTAIRTPKQCRERWNNHLNPEVHKESWNIIEDITLLELVKKYKHQWALISKKMKLRTTIMRSENAVKNRYNCLMKKNRECKTITSLMNHLKQKQELLGNSEPLITKQVKPDNSYLEVKIIKNSNNLPLNGLEPCLVDVNNKNLYQIDKDFLTQVQQYYNQKIEIVNPQSGISHYLDSMNYVKYVPCSYPHMEKKSFFNMPTTFQDFQKQNSQLYQMQKEGYQ